MADGSWVDVVKRGEWTGMERTVCYGALGKSLPLFGSHCKGRRFHHQRSSRLQVYESTHDRAHQLSAQVPFL